MTKKEALKEFRSQWHIRGTRRAAWDNWVLVLIGNHFITYEQSCSWTNPYSKGAY